MIPWRIICPFLCLWIRFFSSILCEDFELPVLVPCRVGEIVKWTGRSKGFVERSAKVRFRRVSMLSYGCVIVPSPFVLGCK